MRKILLSLTAVLFSIFALPSTSHAVALVKGGTAAIVHAPSTTAAVKGTRAFKRPSKFKMWIAKTMIKATSGDSNQIIAVLLAFFLGGIGLHRVYLGSRPIMILWYIISFFGIFGILPLIDFIRLIIQGTSHYVDNNDFLAAFE